MKPQAETGRRLVLAMIVVMLALEVTVIVGFNLLRGPDRLSQQLVRLVLTLGLCVFLYRGAQWARWVVGLSTAAGGLWCVFWVATTFTGLEVLPLLAVGLAYLLVAIVLLLVPAVQAHFASPRAEVA